MAALGSVRQMLPTAKGPRAGRRGVPFMLRKDQQQPSLQPQLQPQLLLQLHPQLQPQPQLLLLQPQPHPQLLLQPQLQTLPQPQLLPPPQQQHRMMIRMMIQQQPPPKPLLFHIRQIPPMRCEALGIASVLSYADGRWGCQNSRRESTPAFAASSCALVSSPAPSSRAASVCWLPLRTMSKL